MYCINCGNHIPEEDKFCTNCGMAIPHIETPEQRKGRILRELNPDKINSNQRSGNSTYRVARPVSAAWYLLPIFLAEIGGIIGYFATRKRDRKRAKRILILGLCFIAVRVAIFIIFMVVLGMMSSLPKFPIDNHFSDLPREFPNIGKI